MAALGPTFLGIGAQKAGTTWLHEMLRQHPDIGLPKTKELHYWDVKHDKGMPLTGYEAIFAAMPQPVRGEITPGYAILPTGTIALIRARYPDLQLLLTLRNPLERAWSNAKMYLVLQKLVPDEPRVAQVEDAWYLEHFRSELSLRRGDYLTCIDNWLQHFDRSQLLLSLYDDLVGDPRAFLARSCRHIGVDPALYDPMDDGLIRQRVGTTAHPEIRASLLPALRDIYADKVAVLSDRLGMDLAERWLTPYR
ncbi:MAG TPA: sulfotransferase [Gammaproteobacteria bacterium]|jgi:hypothetical protein|nr:sulfotransferase [Gammaproteobacteria bacterium]